MIIKKYAYLTIIFVALSLTEMANASYVTYSNQYTISSEPYDQSGFYYSDGRGNSISIRESRSVPVVSVYNNYGIWISHHGVSVPANAIVVQYVNGYPLFACRVFQHRQIYYGKMVPNRGCFVYDLSQQPYSRFELLVR